MTSALEIITNKGNEIWSISAGEMVLEALKRMAQHDIGALIVMEDSKPIGLFTERHYARNVFLKGRSSPETPVRDAMREGFIHVRPDQDIDECMALMTRCKVRHLLVMDGDRLLGVLSIGDLVKSTIADREFTIEQLSNYISGNAA
ncbi:CBS domain-containing protein [Croceicoccus mobilis]|nr:CBS domain-containing protein [Croceicoccus mobilis]